MTARPRCDGENATAAARVGGDGTVRDRPRLGFLGLGWIGLDRLRAVHERAAADIVAVADVDPDARARAAATVPEAVVGSDLSALLAAGVDGVVVATPSAGHAAETIAALEAGAAVFCQKPLARTAVEAAAVLDAAGRADRLLGVDLCYRQTAAMSEAAALVHAGAIGSVYAADLVFHNAYGPDKSWFYDPLRSGGGCLIDLGTHLIDLAVWLDPSPITGVTSRLFSGGRRLALPAAATEDYAAVTLDFASGATVRVACSWNLSAGRDAVIDCRWYGTHGGVRFANVDGSFYDLAAEQFEGTRTTHLVSPPDDWGGRTILAWVAALRRSPRFDPAIAPRVQAIAGAIDRAYGRDTRPPATDATAQAGAPATQSGAAPMPCA